MKYLIVILFFIVFSCKKSSVIKMGSKEIPLSPISKIVVIDSLKASKSKAILKTQLLHNQGGSKYYISSFKVLEIIQNKTNYNIKDTINVAYFNTSKEHPKNKECILYITYFPLESTTIGKDNIWMLIDGDVTYACDYN